MPTKFFGTVRNVIPPFSSINRLAAQNFLKNSRIPLRKFLAVWDIKISTENRDMLPLIHKFFSIPGSFRKTQGFLYKAFRFGPVRQKLRRKIVILPPPPYPNFFDTRNYCNSKGILYGNFRHCETKIFDGKSWYCPPRHLSINIFATGNFLKHSTEGFTYQIFRHCETIKFRQKIENREITLWCINFCATRNFLIHRSVPQRNFSVLWDKKFWTKSRA